jgi:2-keto-3-deoxy-6-phosphogluconate aldolase
MKVWIERCPIIAILRGIKPAEAESIGDALDEAGVRIVEVPLNSPDPFQSIAILSRVFGDRMLVGAGTLTETIQVAQVKDAGGMLTFPSSALRKMQASSPYPASSILLRRLRFSRQGQTPSNCFPLRFWDRLC